MYAKKNNTLKKLISVLSIVLALLVGVAGTLAYLQVQTNDVVNTFAPSNIGLTLVETATESGSTTANTYKMIPGVDIAKDPKVTVTADIDSYVFVEVTETQNFDTYMTYTIASGWKLFNTTSGAATEIAADADLDGTYVLFREVSATKDEDGNDNNHVEAFYVLAGNQVMVPDTVDKDDMNALYNTDGTVKADSQPKLTFTAYAIQKAGFENNLADAWAKAQGQTS